MPRNMSFALTSEQIRNRTKTVTRRRGWKFARPGDVITACVKCMGLKPGEKIKRLGLIQVTNVRRELLSLMCDSPAYGLIEARREGFPEMSGEQFVRMFCQHMGGPKDQLVTRIEFEYLDRPAS